MKNFSKEMKEDLQKFQKDSKEEDPQSNWKNALRKMKKKENEELLRNWNAFKKN